MAFETIDTEALINALNTCKSKLNVSKINQLSHSLSYNSDFWTSDSRKTLYDALKKLSSRYVSLNNLFDSYISIANKIGRYKQLGTQMKNLDREYNELNKNLYYEEEYTTTTKDQNGNDVTETHTRTVKDENVESQIEENRRNSSACDSEMKRIYNEVANSI